MQRHSLAPCDDCGFHYCQCEEVRAVNAERRRIRKAIAPALKVLRDINWHGDGLVAVKAIDRATRKPAKGKP